MEEFYYVILCDRPTSGRTSAQEVLPSAYICHTLISSSSTVAVQPTGMALLLTGTIKTFGLPMIDLAQTTPSVAGSTEGLSAMPLVTSADGPLPLPLLCP